MTMSPPSPRPASNTPKRRPGMVVLVVGQRLAGTQVARGGAGGVAVDGARPDDDMAGAVEADVLDHQIGERRGIAGQRPLAGGGRRGEQQGDGEQPQPHQKWISYSICQRSVCRAAAGVKPNRMPPLNFSVPGPSWWIEPNSCGPMRWSCSLIGAKWPNGPGSP